MQLIPRHDPYMAVRSTGGATVAALRGELDLVLVRHLRPELDALVRESDALTVDIRRLTFCDATGLGLLAHCAVRTRQRGARWRLVCDQPWILRLIRLTELDDVLSPEGPSERDPERDPEGEPEGETPWVFPEGWDVGASGGLPGGLPEMAAPHWDPAGPLLSEPGVTRPVS
ncbi:MULTISPECIES: STAS domain-containing protein [unclassified Streptomyces]|uniref:STAS domain-containing protein n=1 Tax=unclassified Streptomyces TaxID=2593676 RepID=UPI001E552ADE|nr:STAS domain-containing protein [Streptomyces sp. CB02980]MCB8904496.1 STAS domain-containing protein [Streptomyces sp. CB02980]